MNLSNIFTNIPKQLPEELFTSLFEQGTVHIERIVSQGHSTAAGQWYEQDWDEWVIVLAGQARLRYAPTNTVIDMQTGDYVLIPAGTKHRVEWTAPKINTIWLAVHLHDLGNE